jgi:hypothetical protein
LNSSLFSLIGEIDILFQRVIVLKGHGRGITQIKFNREGDLLFTARFVSWKMGSFKSHRRPDIFFE